MQAERDLKAQEGAVLVRDRLAILAVVLVPAVLYVTRLGLYTDDWTFVVQLATAPDQSLPGLYRAITAFPEVAVRPFQAFLYILYYKLAPDSVLFPHLFNLAMQVGAALLLHAALRRTEGLRMLGVVIVLVYFSLPDFVAMKLWYANHMSTASLLAFAWALWLTVRFAQGSGGRFAAALQLAGLVVASLISVLSYELLSFILLAQPLFVAIANGTRLRDIPTNRMVLLATAALVAGFGCAGLFKLLIAPSVVDRPHGLYMLWWWTREIYSGAVNVEFLRLGFGLPLAAWRLTTGPWFAPLAIVAALAGPAAVWLALKDRRLPGTEVFPPLLLILFGLAAFVAGYLPFYVSLAYSPAAFGVSTRDNVGAALGIALIITGAFAWADRKHPRAARTVLAGYLACGLFVQAIQGLNWGAAWDRQQATYAALDRAVPVLRDGDALLLYGICPYDGSAQGYSSSWGLSDRLRRERGLTHIEADTITPRATFGPDGVVVREYSGAWQYRYGQMLIWNVRDGTVHPIANEAAAKAFFAAHPIAQSPGCTYVEGEGEPLF